MTPLRSLLALALVSVGLPARAVEPWADPRLPVTAGLELWLDAGRIDVAAAATREKAVTDGKLAA